MGKFEVGDRVAVYLCGERFKANVKTITANPEGIWVLGDGCVDRTYVHVKQCRRLRPKKKKEPMKIWIPSDALAKAKYGDKLEVYMNCWPGTGTREFVEVVKP